MASEWWGACRRANGRNPRSRFAVGSAIEAFSSSSWAGIETAAPVVSRVSRSVVPVPSKSFRIVTAVIVRRESRGPAASVPSKRSSSTFSTAVGRVPGQ